MDFYLPEQHYAVQASVSLADVDTREREVAALEKLDRLESLSRMVIVTLDDNTNIVLSNGKIIEVVALWSWLLE